MDAKKYAQEQNDLETNHHLTLTTVESGHLLINGVLDPVGGAAVRAALEPLARKSGGPDDRPMPQRHADALVEMGSGGKPAHIPDPKSTRLHSSHSQISHAVFCF